MLFTKAIFNIYLPFASWNVFLQTVGLAGVLVTALGVWITWNSQHAEVVARKEEQKAIVLERYEEKQLRQETILLTLKEAIAFVKENLDEVKSDLGRLTAQVEQIEAEAILKRKIAHLEERFNTLEKMIEK